MSTVLIRNGSKLCANCATKGCDRVIGGIDVEIAHESEDDCDCCGTDFEANDGFGI